MGPPGAAGRRPGLVAVAALALLVAHPACSPDGPGTLDVPATEAAVAEVVAAGVAPGVDGVRCPEEIERTADTTVTCRADLADGAGELRLEVRVLDDDGTLDVEPLDAVVDRDRVATELRDELAATYERDFTVDCGDDGVEVVAPGGTVTCRATDDDGTRDVTVTVADAAGTLRFDVGEDPEAPPG